MRLVTSMLFGLGLMTSPALLSQAAADEGAAILAGGCFWCVEKDFDHVNGVTETTSGYIGGNSPNATYKNHGRDGHLEAVRVVYDTSKSDYRSVLDTFWRTIDAVDDGGQFCDRGNSYRTAVFVLNDEQREIAEASKAEAEKKLGEEIKTRILDASEFWPAEEYHQDFYEKSSARYTHYRRACGRDKRVKRLWGEAAYQGVTK